MLSLALALGAPVLFFLPSANAFQINTGIDELTSPAFWVDQSKRTETIGWKLTFPTSVQVDWVPRTTSALNPYNPQSTGADALEGTMRIEKNFVDLNPISILFESTFPIDMQNPRTPGGLGLRFTLNEVITNSGQDEWRKYGMRLVDTAFQPPIPAADAAHPRFPHFHTVAATTGAPLTYADSGGGTPRVSPSTNFINFGVAGESVAGTGQGMLTLNNIGVHDWEVNGRQRKFTLVEQPNTTFDESPIRRTLTVAFTDLVEGQNVAVDDGGAGGRIRATPESASYDLRVPKEFIPGIINEATAYMLEPGTPDRRVSDSVTLTLTSLSDTESNLALNFTSDRGELMFAPPAGVNNFVIEDGTLQDVSRVFVDRDGFLVGLPAGLTVKIASDVDVPEPSTWLLVVLGMALVGINRGGRCNGAGVRPLIERQPVRAS